MQGRVKWVAAVAVALAASVGASPIVTADTDHVR